MTSMFNWLRKGAEAIGALMMLALFATFLLQIFSRYLMDQPFGWTLELCLILWVWIVFFGCAFFVRNEDHITFDLLYRSTSPGPRRIMAAISALAIVAGLSWSLVPTWDWIDFLRIKRSPTLRVPMRDVYFIYAVFLVAVIAAYAWRLVRILKNEAVDEDAPEYDEARL